MESRSKLVLMENELNAVKGRDPKHREPVRERDELEKELTTTQQERMEKEDIHEGNSCKQHVKTGEVLKFSLTFDCFSQVRVM